MVILWLRCLGENWVVRSRYVGALGPLSTHATGASEASAPCEAALASPFAAQRPSVHRTTPLGTVPVRHVLAHAPRDVVLASPPVGT